MATSKSVHVIILDASALLNNEPSISTLIAKSEKLFTVPSIISEIRDRDARARLETTVLPFLEIRAPRATNSKIVADFARKTGDLAVLSKPDIEVLALAYELECERNHGDWRLRRVPGQKGLNGTPPPKQEDISVLLDPTVPSDLHHTQEVLGPSALTDPTTEEQIKAKIPIVDKAASTQQVSETSQDLDTTTSAKMAVLGISSASDESTKLEPHASTLLSQGTEDTITTASDSSDSEGWITPSNLRKQQTRDQNGDALPGKENKVMQVATITGDFAMQNVLLQMNLNLLSPSMLRVTHLKTYILRCHACFEKTKDMAKQFCPRCGKPTLTRVACSTSANGEFKIHLKKNMQWNTRGDRFSIPKPVPGASNGKVGTGKGGGKGGWGQELILAEDQKEYVQAMQGRNRKKERNLMDEDYLPGILTGKRGRAGGRPKIGGGRNVNSKKR